MGYRGNTSKAFRNRTDELLVTRKNTRKHQIGSFHSWLVYSIFDYLYKQYTKERIAYLKKHKKISEYDSENLMYALIQDILSDSKYSSLDVVCGFELKMLIKDLQPLDERECQFGINENTHLDFLIYNRISKKPVLAIEVDGYDNS